MEEITTRFEIVRLAVKLGDFRTIDLQCEKLRSLSLDDKLNEIIDLLEGRNYRQALYEMKHYAQSLEDEFFSSRREENPSKPTPRKPQASSADLGLFEMEESEEKEETVLNLDDILRLSKRRETPQTVSYEPAPEFKIEATREAPVEKSAKPAGDEAIDQKPVVEEPVVDKLGMDETGEAVESEGSEVTGMTLEDSHEARSVLPNEPPRLDEEESEAERIAESEEEPLETVSVSGMEAWETEESASPDRPEKTAEHLSAPEVSVGRSGKGEATRHSPISYINQKFRNMIHQFPPVEQEGVVPEEVEAMQKKISTEGYTEEEIEDFLKRYWHYKEEGRRSEAALVLLLAAATESPFAQFLLARELFRGEVIQQDHAEAFTQINTLADQNFAEAICDLGQFYEHGVGIGKDRQMALLLYEEAAEMGVTRARKHYERLKKSRGFLGVFKKVSLPKVNIPLPKKR